MVNPDILKQFRCSACGACCRWTGSVLLEEADLAPLAELLGLSVHEFIDGHTRLAPNRRQLALLDQADGSCAFLAGDRCSVYSARPLQCRTFPFAWRVASGCPELDRLLAGQKNVEQPGGNP